MKTTKLGLFRRVHFKSGTQSFWCCIGCFSHTSELYRFANAFGPYTLGIADIEITGDYYKVIGEVENL